MPKSLDELKQKEKMFNSSKLVKRGGNKMENAAAKIENKSVSKICPGCNKNKKYSEYHVDNSAKDKHAKFCKECVSERRQKQMEEHAKNLFYKEITPYTKTFKAIFTVNDVWDKIGSSKQTGYNFLKVMVDLGLLSATKKGVTNYYEIPAAKTEGQYDNLTEEFDQDKVKIHPTIKKNWDAATEKKRQEIKPNTLIEMGDLGNTDSISDDEVQELQDVGVKVSEPKETLLFPKPPKNIVQETIDMIYHEAKEIKIIPATHEIHIKLKGV